MERPIRPEIKKGVTPDQTANTGSDQDNEVDTDFTDWWNDKGKLPLPPLDSDTNQPELRLPEEEPFDPERQEEWERRHYNPDNPDSAPRGVDEWEMHKH